MLSDRDGEMSDHVVNWGEQIGIIAGEFRPTDTKESWLGRAYSEVKKLNPERAKKLTFRHFSDLFYGRVSDPKYSVASSVLTAADQARIEEAKRDAQVVAKFFNSHAQALAGIDPDRNRSDINAFIEAARIISGGNRSGDHGEAK